MRLKIVVPAYNSAPWIRRTLQSIARQTNQDYDVCVIDDASSQDGQREIISEYCRREGWIGVFRERKQGALSNIVDGISILRPRDEDVIILIDGDDWLFHSRVFERITAVYREEPVSLTYGQYLSYPRGKLGIARPIDPVEIESRCLRRMPWKFTHLRTFRSYLWKQVREGDLRDGDGNYFAAAWDLAIMLPMVEMAGHSIKYLHEVLYVWNQVNPLNDHKVHRQDQMRIEQVIRSKPSYPRLVHARCDPDGTTASAKWYNRWLYLRRKFLMPPRYTDLSR